MGAKYNQPWELGESTCMGEKNFVWEKRVVFYMHFLGQQRNAK
jgi:hypothetical protein